MNGEDLLWRILHQSGIEVVFGVPGTQTVGLFDALRRSRLRTVLTTHELAAAFMANGYYRGSGRMGVVTTIPGPGFTFALTGVAEAFHDSSALLLLGFRNDPRPDGRPDLQEIDQAAMAAPVVKEVVRVSAPGELAAKVGAALEVATSGEPGPVYLEILQSTLSAECGEPAPGVGPGAGPRTAPDPSRVTEVRERITKASKVVLFLGQGSQDASPEIGHFVARVGSAAVSNSSGRGVLREDHPNLLCGDFSGWGARLVNELFSEADLVLALGCRMSFNGTSGYGLAIPADKLIHVDASRENLGRTYPVGVGVEGNVGPFLADVLAHLPEGEGAGRGWAPQELLAWKRRFQEGSAVGSDRFPVFDKGGDLGPFFQALRGSLPDDAVVVTDSGLHQVVTRRLLEVRAPRGLIIPSDFQSMGFGLPAAIGAALSSPGRDVVAIVGDGGFAMSGLEVLTAVREGLDLRVIVFSDGHLGQIRRQQLREFGHAHATALGPLDLEGFAEATGASYLAMDGDRLDVLEEVMKNPGVTIVELLLGDSPRTGRERRKALAKARVRRVLGPSIVNALKRAKAALAGDRRPG